MTRASAATKLVPGSKQELGDNLALAGMSRGCGGHTCPEKMMLTPRCEPMQGWLYKPALGLDVKASPSCARKMLQLDVARRMSSVQNNWVSPGHQQLLQCFFTALMANWHKMRVCFAGTGWMRPQPGWTHTRLHPDRGQATVWLLGEIVTDVTPTAPSPLGYRRGEQRGRGKRCLSAHPILWA